VISCCAGHGKRFASQCKPLGCRRVSSFLPRGCSSTDGRGGSRNCGASVGGVYMNRKPNRACREPGCTGYAASGSPYCRAHAAAHARVFRSAAHRKEAARLYRTGQWRALRRQQLTAKPFCAECLKAGRYTPASEVDHIVPHRNDERLFFDPMNLQSLCSSCHSIKTAREDGGFGRARHLENEVASRERIPLR